MIDWLYPSAVALKNGHPSPSLSTFGHRFQSDGLFAPDLFDYRHNQSCRIGIRRIPFSLIERTGLKLVHRAFSNRSAPLPASDGPRFPMRCRTDRFPNGREHTKQRDAFCFRQMPFRKWSIKASCYIEPMDAFKIKLSQWNNRPALSAMDGWMDCS